MEKVDLREPREGSDRKCKAESTGEGGKITKDQFLHPMLE